MTPIAPRDYVRMQDREDAPKTARVDASPRDDSFDDFPPSLEDNDDSSLPF
jgi:hypothetical protein